MKPGLIASLFGWYGVGAILVAYTLISFEIIAPTSSVYPLLNLSGALGIVIESLFKKDYPVTALNTVWAIVAIVSLVLIALR